MEAVVQPGAVPVHAHGAHARTASRQGAQTAVVVPSVVPLTMHTVTAAHCSMCMVSGPLPVACALQHSTLWHTSQPCSTFWESFKFLRCPGRTMPRTVATNTARAGLQASCMHSQHEQGPGCCSKPFPSALPWHCGRWASSCTINGEIPCSSPCQGRPTAAGAPCRSLSSLPYAGPALMLCALPLRCLAAGRGMSAWPLAQQTHTCHRLPVYSPALRSPGRPPAAAQCSCRQAHSRSPRQHRRPARCAASSYSGRTIDVEVERQQGPGGQQTQVEEWPAEFDEFVEEDEAEQDPLYEEEEEQQLREAEAEAEAGASTKRGSSTAACAVPERTAPSPPALFADCYSGNAVCLAAWLTAMPTLQRLCRRLCRGWGGGGRGPCHRSRAKAGP